MSKYYFIYYECKRTSWNKRRGPFGGEEWTVDSTGCYTKTYQTISDKHPLQWQLDCNEKYSMEFKIGKRYK